MPNDLTNQVRNEAILMIYGLAGVRLVMLPLAQFLRRAGYRVVQWSYPSTRRTVVGHAEKMLPALRALNEQHFQRVHVVTHSMGGIVARAALAQQPLTAPGRLVMICPPNRGTPLASRFASYWGWLLRPLAELTHEPASFVNCLPPPASLETGIIAAQNDYIVPLACTQLSGQCDHIVLPGRHTDVLFRRRTWEEVQTFLQTGHFNQNFIIAGREQAGVDSKTSGW